MRLIAGLLLGLALLCACVWAPKAAPVRVAEGAYLNVGGIAQWVTIRGDDQRKPVLLLVHGGPGDVVSRFPLTFTPYERDFVLVQWDQRGAGRTFARNGAKDLTLARQVDDGIDLVEQLHRRYPKNRLVVLGHSWGTAIATGMVQKRPELFSAYVGTGQISSWPASVNYQFDFLKERARAKGDAAALASFEAIGRPDPTNIKQYFSFSRPLRTNMGLADTKWNSESAALAKAAGESEADIKAASDGANASAGALIQTLVHLDLTKTAPRFAVPYYVIQGREDLNAPTDAARAYFDGVTAPKKQFAVIDGAGHFAFATHAEQFVGLLKSMVR